jgi:uncharacterized membrane protein
MESYLLDWANLLLRWLHVITAIAWIGSSFYFVMLDNSLEPPKDKESKDKGVGGELWAVHGGGFYNSQKYLVSPKVLPEHLHWSFWESYSTWFSGFALLSVSYLWNPTTYLIDKARMDWSGPAAVAAALAFLAVFWLLYDGICRIFGQRDRVVGALVALLVGVAAWLACHLFAGRAAFLLVGAMMATSMTLNVLMWIIPGQRKNVAALKAGQPVDPINGLRGKQRSVHNTYFTLPVLFAMLSGHYSFTYGHPQNWLVLIAMMFAGAAIRQFFVARHKFKLGLLPNPLPYALVGAMVLAGVVLALQPAASAPEPSAAAKVAPPGYAAVQPIFAQRCFMCHGEQVQMKNVRLDSPQQVKAHAQALYQQVVVTRVMPLNNATNITEAERQTIRQWFEAGASTD